MDGASILLFK